MNLIIFIDRYYTDDIKKMKIRTILIILLRIIEPLIYNFIVLVPISNTLSTLKYKLFFLFCCINFFPTLIILINYMYVHFKKNAQISINNDHIKCATMVYSFDDGNGLSLPILPWGNKRYKYLEVIYYDNQRIIVTFLHVNFSKIISDIPSEKLKREKRFYPLVFNV